MQLTMFYFLPNILLSGFMFPFQGMPVWAQHLGNLLPLTYFNRLIRGILLKGNGWADLWPHVWPLLIRSEEHTSELQSLMRISYAVFCLKLKILLIIRSNCITVT